MKDSIDTSVNIAGITMQNPVMTASGTFGFGREYGDFYDINKLGALVTKGLTLLPRRETRLPAYGRLLPVC